jgi:hypothetical protein
MTILDLTCEGSETGRWLMKIFNVFLFAARTTEREMSQSDNISNSYPPPLTWSTREHSLLERLPVHGRGLANSPSHQISAL